MILKLSTALMTLLITRECLSLDCFVCHSRQNPDCGDPFPKNGNSSGAIALYECDRVRKVGEGLVAASNAIGGMPSSFTPLTEGGSYVCYKITIGGHAVRGCAKSDFCGNMTDVCDLCNSDGCNGARNNNVPAFINFAACALIFLYIFHCTTYIFILDY